MHSLSPGSNYIIHTITYILLFLGQIICSRNSCHSRKYLVISALVIGSREIIPEHFEHVTHAQACLNPLEVAEKFVGFIYCQNPAETLGPKV